MKTRSVFPVRRLPISLSLLVVSVLIVMAICQFYSANHFDKAISFYITARDAGRCPQFLYLITGAGELPRNLSTGLQSNRSHVVMLSYAKDTPTTTIFAPNTTWTQARNMLIDYARQFEIERDCRAGYWTFLDGDLILDPEPVPEYVREYEDFLLEWRPAIGMPQLLTKEYPVEVKSCAAFDAMFNSFERDVVDQVLPYDDSEDTTSWWISQLIVIYKSTRFKDHVLTRLGGLRVTNPEHHDYPKNPALMKEQEKLLEYLIPEQLRHCIDADINEAVEYWGTPKNKTHPYTVPVRWTHAEIINCRSTLVARRF